MPSVRRRSELRGKTEPCGDEPQRYVVVLIDSDTWPPCDDDVRWDSAHSCLCLKTLGALHEVN